MQEATYTYEYFEKDRALYRNVNVKHLNCAGLSILFV